MGWCSATYLFDNIVGALLGKDKIDTKEVIKNLINTLEEGDWDCQQDSDYYDHPVVKEIFGSFPRSCLCVPAPRQVTQ